jgi:hypothetical protein
MARVDQIISEDVVYKAGERPANLLLVQDYHDYVWQCAVRATINQRNQMIREHFSTELKDEDERSVNIVFASPLLYRKHVQRRAGPESLFKPAETGIPALRAFVKTFSTGERR